MYYLRNALYLINGGLKCFFTKLFHPSSFRFKGLTRMALSSRMTLLNEANMSLGKNIRIVENSVIASLKKGELILGDNVSLGGNNRIICHDSIIVGDGTIMGPNVCIYDHDHIYSKCEGVNRNMYKTAPVEIGKGCWIGANVVILRGTTLGDNCLIGAGCVLKGKYPSGSKVIQKRDEEIF